MQISADRRRCRVCRVLAWLAGALALCALAAWWLSFPPTPDAFYQPPAVGAAPGTLLRAAPFTRDVPAGARGWRILYATQRDNGVPAVASALVVAPLAAASQPLPVIAWTHGTTGVAIGCAPSLLAHPFADLAAPGALIARGWAIVATDYTGLGTRGPGVVPTHTYLVGADEAYAELDALRAARQLDGVRLSGQFVVWGYSQGGHAALWTGILAPRYAPELTAAGVAAIAPATDLPRLVQRTQSTLPGRILNGFLVTGYAAAYPDVHFDEVVRRGARLLSHDIARRCLVDARALTSIAEGVALGGSIYRATQAGGAFGQRLEENTPTAHIAAPLLIAQGLADDLVYPDVQGAYVERQCRSGQPLTYLTYPGRDHDSVVAADSPVYADLVQWSVERFQGLPVRDHCPGVLHDAGRQLNPSREHVARVRAPPGRPRSQHDRSNSSEALQAAG